MANLIPLEEFANMLGISPEQVREMRERNEIHGYRDGSSWKFKETEVERAKAALAQRGGDDDFKLTGKDSDEDSSDSMDSILIEDTGGGDGESGSHIIGGDDDELTLVGSDINLADGSSKKGPPAAGDTGSQLNLSKVEDSDVLATETIVGNNLDDDDDIGLATDSSGSHKRGPSESDSDIALGEEARDPGGTGSEINLDLGEESLDLGASGIGSSMGLGDDALGLDFDSSDSSDMEIDLAPDDDDMAIKSEKPADDLDLLDDEDDAVELNSDSGEVAAGSGVNLGEEDDMFADLEPASQSSAGDDFMLEPVEGGELGEEDDSGSQVIALDSESISSDSALFASDSGLEEDAFGGLEEDVVAVDDADGEQPARAPAGAASVAAEPPYSLINVLSLLGTAAVVLVAGLMVTDLMLNIWSFNEPYALNSTIMDQILSILGE